MLSKYFNLDNIKIMSRDEYALYPKASDRDFWDNLSEGLRSRVIENGEKYLGYEYPLLLMSDYLKFERTGERTAYEIPYAERRTALYALILAECTEHKGRFLDDIINGIYLICDETSWVVHAHNYKDIRYGTHDGNNTAPLPVDDNIVIDIRSSETSFIVSLAFHCLKSELDAVSPLICKRIEKKIDERIVSLYEKYDEYFWKNEVCNWNVYCNAYCLATGMITIEDNERRKNFVRKVLESINVYFTDFNNDGGTEEGPLYWTHSCGNFFRAIDIIKYVTYGKVDITKEQKSINMANYPSKMYIGDKRFVNFADALSYSMPPYELAYNFGIATGNSSLVALSKIAKEINPVCNTIESVMVFDKIDKVEAEFSFDKEYYYPDLQVLTLRENDILFAARGGYNNEPHNHADVGSFMIYKNNKPVVIDPGTGQYISSSFTPARYDIWYNNSKHHNLPLINGEMQKGGPRYSGKALSNEELFARCLYAKDVKYENDTFSLDIADAYDSENIKKWERKFFFDRKNGRIDVAENYELSAESEIEITLMTTEKPQISNGFILLPEGVKLFAENLAPEVEEICNLDKKIGVQWNGVYRLALKTKGKNGEIKYSFVM